MDYLPRDFDKTLALIRKLRAEVAETPIVGEYPNPAARLMASEQLHLRGLARLIGPVRVQNDILSEFSASSELARELTEMVNEDSQNPVAPILRDTQTHIRGCAAILANAKAASRSLGDATSYGDLFTEPTDPRAVEHV